MQPEAFNLKFGHGTPQAVRGPPGPLPPLAPLKHPNEEPHTHTRTWASASETCLEPGRLKSHFVPTSTTASGLTTQHRRTTTSKLEEFPMPLPDTVKSVLRVRLGSESGKPGKEPEGCPATRHGPLLACLEQQAQQRCRVGR